jgi:hypothetical protein
MEHAERHAIFEAARRRTSPRRSFRVSIALARSSMRGIACLDMPAPAFDDPVWGAYFEQSQIILRKGGVRYGSSRRPLPARRNKKGNLPLQQRVHTLVSNWAACL